jgi:hypothetical protein
VRECLLHRRTAGERTLKGIGEFASTEDAVHFARDMLAAVEQMFALWYRFRGEGGAGRAVADARRTDPTIDSNLKEDLQSG